MKPTENKISADRKEYQVPKLEKESFFEETGLFGSIFCSSHYCQNSGYCSSYAGNDCN